VLGFANHEIQRHGPTKCTQKKENTSLNMGKRGGLGYQQGKGAKKTQVLKCPKNPSFPLQGGASVHRLWTAWIPVMEEICMHLLTSTVWVSSPQECREVRICGKMSMSASIPVTMPTEWVRYPNTGTLRCGMVIRAVPD